MTAAFKTVATSIFLAGLAVGALVACKPREEIADHSEAASPAAAAVANPARSNEDRADDPKRKPVAVLEFAGPASSMRVFEMEAGRGYYTELLSHMVGENGEVIAQNPAAFDAFLNGALQTRIDEQELANVRASKSKFDALDAADASIDLVTWFLGPHELYFTPANGQSLGDPETAYAEAFRILKPGGDFVVLDHAAAPGAPSTMGNTLHRIDPAIVKALAEGAGFELVDESDILRNPQDDYSMGVFDPKVRRQTDRFLLKYRKRE